MKNTTCVCGLPILLLVAGLFCEALVVSSGFVETRGTEFIVDGSPFLFNGFNSYWLMTAASQLSQRSKVSDVFREAVAAGLTVCRTWAFSNGGEHALQMSPGVYSETVFQGLDFVISEARKYGLKLILSLSNNFKESGGKAQYVQWARSAGVPIPGEDDFYTNSVVKAYYKNNVKKVLTRMNTLTQIAYKDDSIIMAWELINEPRCQADPSGRTLHGWVQEMASYVKSIDNKHLLEIGMEGFYGDSIPDRKQYNPEYQVGTDFIANNRIKEIDFTTIHAYPDHWLFGRDENVQLAFLQRWLTSHCTDSRTILKKPMVFSEFGKSKRGVLSEFGKSNIGPGYNETARDAFLNTLYTNLYKLARRGGIGGGLVWQIMAPGMESYHDGYEIVLSQSPSTAAIITQQSRKMAALELASTNTH